MLLIICYSTQVLNLNLHSHYSLPDHLLFLFGQNLCFGPGTVPRTTTLSVLLCPADSVLLVPLPWPACSSVLLKPVKPESASVLLLGPQSVCSLTDKQARHGPSRRF